MPTTSSTRIAVVRGDITGINADAIVNAANNALLGGGGVDGAIHRAAGPGLLAECKGIGGCPTGEARITGGYNLPARHVIHTVGPVYRNRPEDPKLLAACYRNSLTLAVENGLRTIAFPAISCGVYGYPLTDACSIAIATTQSFLDAHPTIDNVTFVLFSEADAHVYRQALAAVE
jgi:O-acetyl-ADP-ribose deacetylase (regulator of RNase III)